ncbi:TetR family transcriptional regulator, partial [Kocuria sp. CPCC 204721]|uniref:TetR family transcriptional regulator n=1 Tax=Kocuria sp. CPCC 204721 TaxID=3073548 RepID=UPI0034D6B860
PQRAEQTLIDCLRPLKPIGINHLGPRQVRLAREMYEEKGPDGKRAHTVEHIAQEFGVTRPTIYRHLAKP